MALAEPSPKFFLPYGARTCCLVRCASQSLLLLFLLLFFLYIKSYCGPTWWSRPVGWRPSLKGEVMWDDDASGPYNIYYIQVIRILWSIYTRPRKQKIKRNSNFLIFLIPRQIGNSNNTITFRLHQKKQIGNIY
jgi:hypothetical protein